MQHSTLVYVKRAKGKGRGVFARCPIAEGTVIEKVPVLLVPINDLRGGRKNDTLGAFCFLRGKGKLAIALGYGSLYNHSYAPNAMYEEEPGPCMTFRAVRDIAQGEEITINYNGAPEDRAPVWFEVV
jgi:SET domain-containing protein